MGWRSRLAYAARAWLACLALQCAAAPIAEAEARPTAAMCIAADRAPARESARSSAARDAAVPRAGTEAPSDGAATPARPAPPWSTTEPRVLVPRLYLRLLSIRC